MLFELCQNNEIPDPGSKGFEVKHKSTVTSLFVVHRDSRFTAFINSCPHTGVNLEWQEDTFLDLDKSFIQCSTHDALFDITSGECIFGPCVGDYLIPIQLSITDSMICVDLE